MQWSEWLHAKLGRTHAISLNHLAEALFEFLTSVAGVAREIVVESMVQDLQRGARSEAPEFLRPFITSAERRAGKITAGARRQARHLA